MLTKIELKNLLDKYDLKPNKLLGQNFLVDRNILDKIIAAANLTKNDTVLEVGPGLGTLTEALAKEAGKVITVEKDRKMAAVLDSILKDKNIKNVEIIEGDILKILSSRFQIQSYKIVANIPYYLTARLIRTVLESEKPPGKMVLMIQKEVAQRICARPPSLRSGASGRAKPPRLRQGYGGQAKMSLLAVSVQFYARPKIISVVSKGSFWPKPKVDSAILEISEIDKNGAQIPRVSSGQFFKVVHAGFSHPRKQLVNNLSAGLKIGRDEITSALKKIGLEPEQRAETLNVENWINLTELLEPEN